MAVKSLCSIDGCGKYMHGRGLCRNHLRRMKRYGDPKGGTGRGELEAFIKEAFALDTDECILWPYGTMASGYGVVKKDGRSIGAHRLICIMEHGTPPVDRPEAGHRCGNAGCINKKHLRWISPAQNQADRIEHGTSNRGDRHGLAKLKSSDIPKIRAFRDGGSMTQREIADYFGVSVMTINRVCLGKAWSHIP